MFSPSPCILDHKLDHTTSFWMLIPVQNLFVGVEVVVWVLVVVKGVVAVLLVVVVLWEVVQGDPKRQHIVIFL